MGLEKNDLKSEREIALHLAYEAGKLALDFEQKGFRTEYKSHGQGPVTDADKALNELIVERLRLEFPKDRIIGEESADVSENSNSERVWFIDPIDGTKSFVNREGHWAVMIGLAIRGQSALGVVYQPTTDQLYYGALGGGAFFLKGQEKFKLKIKEVASSDKMVVVRSRHHPSGRISSMIEKIGSKQDYEQGSVGLKIAHIAEGRAHLYMNFSRQTHAWDLCAPEIILKEAGGSIVFPSGNPVGYGFPTVINEHFIAGTPFSIEKAKQAYLQMEWE